MDNFSNCMNPPVDDGLTGEIADKADVIADCIREKYTVCIYPSKNGIKITKHKEKIVK